MKNFKRMWKLANTSIDVSPNGRLKLGEVILILHARIGVLFWLASVQFALIAALGLTLAWRHP